MRSALARYWTGVRNLGAFGAGSYLYRQATLRLGQSKTMFALRSRYACAPLWCRPDSSDVDVFKQIFCHREYRCLDAVRHAELIVDCGANVGFASAYLLTRFPGASVIAIEPDAANYAVLQRNLQPYGSRATTVQSGVWSEPCGLVMSGEKFGDGREWSCTVRRARADEKPTMIAIDLGALLRASGRGRISVLKVDIEGAEVEVFRVGRCDWLSHVDNIVIELHGPEAERIFRAAIHGRGFHTFQCDELTVCTREA
ncbi:MAG TPA: FkbM family methyltransferase [Gemmatimonadaceae bacterium]|nr:FkbM family methyltransferase [Gemmatimonadaceae bacterium]